MENKKLIDELYEKYYKYLLYIAKQTIPTADAEDIVHDVFLNLMESSQWLAQCILKSNNSNELKCILRTFLRNACIDYYKHSTITHDIFHDMPDDKIVTISIDVEQKYCNTYLFEHIANIISKLKGRGKDIIIKYYIEGYSIDELAEQTELSPWTIKTYLHRMLEYIRENLKNL